MKNYSIVLSIVMLTFSYAHSQIRFESASFDSLLVKAKSGNKLVFIDVYATWCLPCIQFEKVSFQNQAVADMFNKHFINARFDEANPEGKFLSELFDVTAFPNLLFIDGDGKIVNRYCGYLEPKELIALARKTLEEPDYQKVNEEYEKHRSVEAIFKKANNSIAVCESAESSIRELMDSLESQSSIGNKLRMTKTLLLVSHLLIEERDEKSLLKVLEIFTGLNSEITAIVKQSVNNAGDVVSDGLVSAAKFYYSAMEAHEYYSFLKEIKPFNNDFYLENTLETIADVNLSDSIFAVIVDDLDSAIGVDYQLMENLRNILSSTADEHKLRVFARGQVKFFKKLGEKALILNIANYLNTLNLSYETNNNIAWDLFLEKPEPSVLLIALELAKKSISLKEEPFNYDTYAAILFELGKKQEAISAQKKAVQLAKVYEPNRVSEYDETLKKYLPH